MFLCTRWLQWLDTYAFWWNWSFTIWTLFPSYFFGSHKDIFHLWLISSLDLVFSTRSCSIQWRFFGSIVWHCLQLHTLLMFFMIILLFLSSRTFFPSLFGVGFFPCGFLYFSDLQIFGCDWVPHQALFLGPKFAFSIVVSLLFMHCL